MIYLYLIRSFLMTIYRKILFFLFALLPVWVYANSFDFENLTNDKGLSNSSVTVIFQDSEGLMWFGTWDGLNVYNGREFKVFKPDPANSNSISNNIIRDITEEKEGIMWIATDFGINRFDKKRNKFTRFFSDGENYNISTEREFLIARDNEGKIFSAIYGRGIFYFDDKTEKFEKLTDVTENLNIRKLFFDLDNNLWFYTDSKKLYKIVFKKNNLNSPAINNTVLFQHIERIENVFYTSKNDIWIQTRGNEVFVYHISEGVLETKQSDRNNLGVIRSVAEYQNYEITGTSNGLYRIEAKGKQFEEIFSNMPVLSVYSGSQDIIWVGTDGQGVWQLSPLREKFDAYSSNNIDGFERSAVRTFIEDGNRNLWVGTKGEGIYVISQNDNTRKFLLTRKITEMEGLLNNSVFTIVRGKSELWIGTDGNGVNYYDTKSNKLRKLTVNPTGVNLSSVYAILPDGEDILWVGTSGSGLYKLTVDRSTTPYSLKEFRQYSFRTTEPKSLSNNIVYSIIRADDSHLWIGTRGGGLNRFNIVNEEFESWRFSQNNDSSISSDDILCLHKDRSGTLWAGTSMGLNKMMITGSQEIHFKRFTEKEGMPNNTIHGILEDEGNNLWLSTNKGIAKLIQATKTDFRIVSYYRKDGLQNNEFSDGAFYKSPYSKKFYFGTIDGFSVFNPMEISQDTYMPSLLLDAFLIDNTEMNLFDMLRNRKGKDVLVLSNKNKSFSFRFVAMDYISGSKSEMAYMIEGYQSDWIQLGTSNTIVLSNLPKGDYVLKVKWSNADKIWSSDFYSIPIYMQPPWWDTTVAYIIYITIIGLIIFLVLRFLKYQLKVRKSIELKELEKQKTEEIHQAKLRFFTNIAHEFSNSLTLIYGPCEQLLSTHTEDAFTRKNINTIKVNSERMQTLIQQLIDFRKAETGHLKLKMEAVDIPELIRFVADNFQNAIEQQKIQLSLKFSPNNISWVTDRNSIEKLIFNLLSNAVKYTPQKEKIEITAEVKGNKLMLNVTNTGIGIKNEFSRSIFDRFEVLNRFEKQISKGLEIRNGIGLALCKSITDILGGDIQVISDETTYTSFIIHLPKQSIDIVEIQIENVQPEQIPIEINELQEEYDSVSEISSIPDTEKQGLVLIVDDDESIRRWMRELLEDKYETAEAENGKEAIDLMKIRFPSIIISDVLMPVMDGVEFVKIMKNQELTSHIPIILLSSKNSVENQIEGLEIGADAYLGKPFQPRHLRVLVDNLLHKNKIVSDYSDSHASAMEQFEGKLISKEDKNLIAQITKIIYEQMDNESLSVEFISGSLAISKIQLYRKIKEITEQTPTEYIRSIRLKHAKKLLKTTSKTVQEIMYLSGFNNKAYFYREFAKKYQQTPKEIRNE